MGPWVPVGRAPGGPEGVGAPAPRGGCWWAAWGLEGERGGLAWHLFVCGGAWWSGGIQGG